MRWNAGKRRTQGNRSAPLRPDPYAPNSPGFDERHQVTETVLLGGTVCVEVGAPVHRLPGEGERISSPAAPTEQPPIDQPSAPSVPAEPRRERSEPDLKPGLGKPTRDAGV